MYGRSNTSSNIFTRSNNNSGNNQSSSNVFSRQLPSNNSSYSKKMGSDRVPNYSINNPPSTMQQYHPKWVPKDLTPMSIACRPETFLMSPLQIRNEDYYMIRKNLLPNDLQRIVRDAKPYNGPNIFNEDLMSRNLVQNLKEPLSCHDAMASLDQVKQFQRNNPVFVTNSSSGNNSTNNSWINRGNPYTNNSSNNNTNMFNSRNNSSSNNIFGNSGNNSSGNNSNGNSNNNNNNNSNSNRSIFGNSSSNNSGYNNSSPNNNSSIFNRNSNLNNSTNNNNIFGNSNNNNNNSSNNIFGNNSNNNNNNNSGNNNIFNSSNNNRSGNLYNNNSSNSNNNIFSNSNSGSKNIFNNNSNNNQNNNNNIFNNNNNNNQNRNNIFGNNSNNNNYQNNQNNNGNNLTASLPIANQYTLYMMFQQHKDLQDTIHRQATTIQMLSRKDDSLMSTLGYKNPYNRIPPNYPTNSHNSSNLNNRSNSYSNSNQLGYSSYQFQRELYYDPSKDFFKQPMPFDTLEVSKLITPREPGYLDETPKQSITHNFDVDRYLQRKQYEDIKNSNHNVLIRNSEVSRIISNYESDEMAMYQQTRSQIIDDPEQHQMGRRSKIMNSRSYSNAGLSPRNHEFRYQCTLSYIEEKRTETYQFEYHPQHQVPNLTLEQHKRIIMDKLKDVKRPFHVKSVQLTNYEVGQSDAVIKCHVSMTKINLPEDYYFRPHYFNGFKVKNLEIIKDEFSVRWLGQTDIEGIDFSKNFSIDNEQVKCSIPSLDKECIATVNSIPPELLQGSPEEAEQYLRNVLKQNTQGNAQLISFTIDPPQYMIKLTRLNPEVVNNPKFN